jgi:endonuclease III
MPVSTRRTTSTTVPAIGEEELGKRTRPSITSSLAATTAFVSDDSPSKRTKKVKREVPVAVTPEPMGRRKKSSATTASASTPRKKVVGGISPDPELAADPPQGWEDIYSLVEELRSDRSAPVDNNGSEALPQRDLGDKVFRFQVLVALMLSSQTKDGVVGDTMRALQKHGLTVDNISATPAEELNKIIHKVGFHNNKTKYIKQVVEVLKEEYQGDIPPSAEEMMQLSGVGPKMAFIVENVAWGKSSGIGVDTHMHRMFNELKWVNSKNPEQTRLQLQSWLPRDKWETINLLWVGFGQEVQQFKPKLLEKALNCSRPLEALRLVKRLGLDYTKEAAKAGLEGKLRDVKLSAKAMKLEEG